MSSNAANIESLIDRAAGGDQQALADVFGQFRPRLRKMIAFRMDRNLQGRVDPSDVLQESFLALSEKLPEFPRRKMSLFVWVRLITMERLMRIHRAHITTQKRDARRDLSIDRQLGTDATSMSIAIGLLDNATSVAGKVAKREQQAALVALLEQMDPIDREIVALRIFEGLSNGEAAETLELTKQTASKRFLRAMQRLRESMLEIPGLADFFSND